MMSEVYHHGVSLAASVARLIRAHHSGMCSDEPRGVAYPDVPSVADVMDAAGLADSPVTTEAAWLAICDVVAPD